MSQTGMPEFDATVQEANVWLNDVAQEMGRPDKRVAYHALRGVLHALRDRMPVNEVFDLSAQLPLIIRGIFFEGYRPSGKPDKLSQAEFVARVRMELDMVGGDNPVHAAEAVFTALERHITRGELDQIRSILPADVRQLWPEHVA